MSNNYWDEEEDDDAVITGNESDGDLQKKLRKKIRADEKRMRELEEKLDGYVKKEREFDVKSILEKQGVNPKAARLILKDLDEVNPESIQNWLEENGDLFGYSAPDKTPGSSDENLADLLKQDGVTEGAKAPNASDSAMIRLANADTEEEVLAIMNGQ